LKKKDIKIETKLIHSGEPVPRVKGAVTLPIFQSSTYEYIEGTRYEDLKYIRLNNTPNHEALHQKLAALENADEALVTASGMAAISSTLMTLLPAGSHLLVHHSLYGGTYDFVAKDFSHFGYTYDFIDGENPVSWEKHLKSETKAIYVETITNPLMMVPDLKAVVRFAREKGLVSIIDNTFATPMNFRPAEWGFDLSLHSCTKYLNGHSDIVAGAVIGRRELVEKIKGKLMHLGGSLDTHPCFLLQRGLKTLAVRIGHQNQSALEIARFLESHPAVSRVNYPGLESHPRHKRAAELFDGFGGMLSFELSGGTEAAERFFKKVSIPIIAPSLGGIETLLTRPVTTSHALLSPEELEKLGISEGLIRVSVGLEAADDLIDDFKQAL
jgi:cystathionine beta-lyase/cystathionine gamma-synthase